MPSRTLTIAITLNPDAGLREAAETPPLPDTSRIREILITTNTPSPQLWAYIALTDTPGLTTSGEPEGSQPIFTYLGQYPTTYEGFIRLLTPSIHLTALDIPAESRILYAIARNDQPATPAAVDILITITTDVT